MNALQVGQQSHGTTDWDDVISVERVPARNSRQGLEHTTSRMGFGGNALLFGYMNPEQVQEALSS